MSGEVHLSVKFDGLLVPQAVTTQIEIPGITNKSANSIWFSPFSPGQSKASHHVFIPLLFEKEESKTTKRKYDNYGSENNVVLTLAVILSFLSTCIT